MNISSEAIAEARRRLTPYILQTPLVMSERVSEQFGCEFGLKAESLQHTGSFKARGAMNAVLQLPSESVSAGVVTHSSGNHAAALARAAGLRSVPAHIVMPHDSSPRKIAAVRGYGIEPVLCEPDTDSREQTAEQLRLRTGATLIHPFDNPDVICGQGTVGSELLEQWPDVDVIVLPVGGGGLLAGILTFVKAVRPTVRVIAAEPELADDTARSLEAGCIQPAVRFDTVADGLRTTVGRITFPVIQSLLDDLVLVSEEEILQAARLLAEDVHLVAEPSGAVTTAAVRKISGQLGGQRVAAVISGGNVNMQACSYGRS